MTEKRANEVAKAIDILLNGTGTPVDNRYRAIVHESNTRHGEFEVWVSHYSAQPQVFARMWSFCQALADASTYQAGLYVRELPEEGMATRGDDGSIEYHSYQIIII